MVGSMVVWKGSSGILNNTKRFVTGLWSGSTSTKLPACRYCTNHDNPEKQEKRDATNLSDKAEKSSKRIKTPIGKLDELEEGRHPYQEKEPLRPWPDNTNPKTGETGGPRGPEPTRYGDWERKGRVSDF